MSYVAVVAEQFPHLRVARQGSGEFLRALQRPVRQTPEVHERVRRRLVVESEERQDRPPQQLLHL